MNSYAQGSSMHRTITASRFVKWSMPFADKKTLPQLTDEEVFDVVAFMNCDSIHPRPYRDLKKDCPDIEFKPIDFPAGPYLDPYPESQHKLGPFKPIKEFYDKRNRKTNTSTLTFLKPLFLFIFIAIGFHSEAQISEANYKIYSVKLWKEVTLSEIGNDFANYDVLFFGEEHNDSVTHYLESKMFEMLYQKIQT